MFCTQCGNEVSNSAAYCGRCGAPIGGSKAQEQIPAMRDRSAGAQAESADAMNADMPSGHTSVSGATDAGAGAVTARAADATQGSGPIPAVVQASDPGEPRALNGKAPNALNGKIVGVLAAIAAVLLVVVALFASNCSSGNTNVHEQAQASRSAATEAAVEQAEDEHVTFADFATMGDEALCEALVDDGYDRTVNGYTAIFKKDGRRIDVNNAQGWRGFYIDEGDIAQVMKDEGPEFSKFGEYEKPGAVGFAIGICEMEGDEGLVAGSGKGAIAYSPGHMDGVKNLSSSARVEYYMSAQEAAAALADAIEAEGYSHSAGDQL